MRAGHSTEWVLAYLSPGSGVPVDLAVL